MKSTEKKVIVAGHVCIDITPAFPETGRKKISDILMPGKLIETKGVSVSTGGAVANTGLATAAGAVCVSAYDALSGLKPLNELRAKISSGWEKN